MIEIDLPDGTIAEFPDNMQPEDIEAVLRQQFGGEQQPAPSKNGAGLLGLPAVAVEGASLGFAPKIAAGLGSLFAKPVLEAREALTGQEAPTLGQLYEIGVDKYQNIGNQAREDFPIAAPLAEIGGAIGTGIAAAGTAPIRALGSLASRGGIAGRTLTGAGIGEGSQRLYEAGAGESGKELETLGRKGVSLGGILGGAFPAVGSGINHIKKILTPKIKESAKPIIALAKKYDIPLGLDDITDSDFYKYAISEGGNMPWSGAGSSAETQLKKFTKAVAKTVGLEDAQDLTPANMDKAFAKVGKEFDELTKGKTFNVNDDVLGGLDDIREVAERGGFGDAGEKQLDKYLKEFYATIDGDGAIKGESVAKIRAKLNKISRTASDQNAKGLAGEMESIISDLISDGSPLALRQAKYKYKNLIALEPLAQKSQVDGIISPALLSSRVSQVYKRQMTRGKAGELGDLAIIGQAIKQTVPQSGTAPRRAVQEMFGGGAALGAGFINPIIPAAYFGGRGIGLGVNRALQARNVDPKLLGKLASGAADAPQIQNMATPLSVGSVLGVLQ